MRSRPPPSFSQTSTESLRSDRTLGTIDGEATMTRSILLPMAQYRLRRPRPTDLLFAILSRIARRGRQRRDAVVHASA